MDKQRLWEYMTKRNKPVISSRAVFEGNVPYVYVRTDGDPSSIKTGPTLDESMLAQMFGRDPEAEVCIVGDPGELIPVTPESLADTENKLRYVIKQFQSPSPSKGLVVIFTKLVNKILCKPPLADQEVREICEEMMGVTKP